MAINITGDAFNNVLTAGSAADHNIFGLGGNDTLNGNAGNDRLDGGTGADAMNGGGGNDVYIVDNVLDNITEFLFGGTDRVESSISWSLAPDPFVENLTLTGLGNNNATGNGLNNVIVGNAGNNVINGGLGADTMAGGLGNDSYHVDNLSDSVIEAAGGGTEWVYATVSHTLSANVENLDLDGVAAINGTGNELANVIYGNGSANSLSSLAGTDSISGYGGADTIRGGAGADTLSGGLGADRFVFAKGEAAGDQIVDFAADDLIQLTGYGAGSTITKVAGSATDWLIRDGVTGQTEILKLTNAYNLGAGDFVFG